MKKIICIILALALSLSLAGCSPDQLLGLFVKEEAPTPTHFEKMQYTRPNPEDLQNALEETCLAVDSQNIHRALDAVEAFYETYNRFDTNVTLAFIYYTLDTTDEQWQEENSVCTEMVPQQEAILDALCEHIAASDLRQELEEGYFGEGFFTYYDTNTDWDETMTRLLEEEAALIDEYYTLSRNADTYPEGPNAYYNANYESLAQLYAQLILKRREIARESGYDDYASLAFEQYHQRSYTPAQAKVFLENISRYITPAYREVVLSDIWYLDSCQSSETFAYVQAAANAMGGTPAEAFAVLTDNQLYDIAHNTTKYAGAYETYLWAYNVPFIFVNPYMSEDDKLTFAHEFGHFTNDYACSGSTASTDVAEIHSQAFEYLSLCYTENCETLSRYKLADSVATYAESAAFALFEQLAYELPEEDLTPENLYSLFEQTGNQFGFNAYTWNPKSFVTIHHFYTQPMYTLSYAISNDLAMQIYEAELESPGAGLAIYEQCLNGEQEDIGRFAELYGLTNPLEEERLRVAAAFLEEKLFP